MQVREFLERSAPARLEQEVVVVHDGVLHRVVSVDFDGDHMMIQMEETE